MQAERYEEAAKAFTKALQSDGGLSEAGRNLAICEFELRDYAEARKRFDSSNTSRYYLGRIDLIEGRFDSAIRRLRSLDEEHISSSNPAADFRYFLGVAYFKKGQLDESVREFQSQIAMNPRDFRAHEWLARAFQKLGRSGEANQEFATTRSLHEYYTQGSVALANCRSLMNAGKTEDAWLACRPMLNGNDVDKIAALGMLFGEASDHAHVLAIWQKAVALDPESPELNYNLALASFLVKDIANAKRYARNACELWPQFPEANVLYGTILYMLADDAEAVKVLTHAAELRPDDPNPRRLLAELQQHARPHQN